MKRFATLLASSICLAGCTPMHWVKPGVDMAQARVDAAECAEEGRRYAWSQIPYFRSPIPSMVRNAQGRAIVVWQESLDPYRDQFFEEHRATYFCLRTRGYELVPAPK